MVNVVYCPYKHALKPGGKKLQKISMVLLFSAASFSPRLRENLKFDLDQCTYCQAVPQQSRVGCSCYSAGHAVQIRGLSGFNRWDESVERRNCRHENWRRRLAARGSCRLFFLLCAHFAQQISTTNLALLCEEERQGYFSSQM